MKQNFEQIYHVWEGYLRTIPVLRLNFPRPSRYICEKYQSRDEQFPELKGEGNLVSIKTGIFR